MIVCDVYDSLHEKFRFMSNVHMHENFMELLTPAYLLWLT